jgi:hypothetical protein
MYGRALVAWNLRRISVKQGFSQVRLAYDAGVDRSYVSCLEGREENPPRMAKPPFSPSIQSLPKPTIQTHGLQLHLCPNDPFRLAWRPRLKTEARKSCMFPLSLRDHCL